MTIYRGPGGGGDATTDAEITALAAIAAQAEGYATDAAASASSASTSATAAAASASSASTSASAASTSATNAATSAISASNSASSASSSATSAASSATDAAASATTASTAASNASTSATNAATSATNAASSATAAAASATTADAAATSASSSASAAYTSASNAASSASAAASSATSASGSASSAASSATSASNSASAAATSATNAANSAAAAAASADEAEAILASSLLKANNLSDLTNAATARTNLGLGTAATQDSTAFATAAQGALADTAVQPNSSPSFIDTLSDKFSLDTTAGAAAGVGEFVWDDGNGTATLGLKGGNVMLQVGQETLARVYNDSGSALTDGQIVYISGAQGNRIAVKLAKADSEATSAGTLGMVTEPIAIGAEGFITILGTVNGLNTSGLTAGDLVYLSASTAGGYSTTPPTAPNHRVTVGYVERVHATVGSIYVKVDNGYELDELHNVVITTPADGEVLAYDSATDTWQNTAAASGLPSQTGNAGKYLTTNGTTASWGTLPLVFPFYKATGTLDTIPLVSGTYLPFTNYAGTSKNIALTA